MKFLVSMGVQLVGQQAIVNVLVFHLGQVLGVNNSQPAIKQVK